MQCPTCGNDADKNKLEYETKILKLRTLNISYYEQIERYSKEIKQLLREIKED